MTTHKILLLPLILISGILLFTLAGCASGRVPRNGPTMAEVYEASMNESNGGTLNRVRADVQAPATITGTTLNPNYMGYTLNASNQITNLFPTLPNPQLVMYIYPHLAGIDQAPIPGYSTAFPLYSQTHYALPGEVPEGDTSS